MDYTKYIDYLITWIKKKVNDSGAKGVILGLSGGIDSALVAALSKLAFPNNSLGIIMPINNMDHDLGDIDLLIKKIKIKTNTIDLELPFNILKEKLALEDEKSISNIKPRLRMTTLYSLAQERNYLVLGTGNKVEWELGYFTKYGDGGADIYPIINLLKFQVNDIAKILGVPLSIINKKPSAGLFEGQTDEDDLGFSYKDADNYFLKKYVNDDIKAKINSFMIKSNHKRNNIIKPLSIIELDNN